jgi:hypothetical protein
LPLRPPYCSPADGATTSARPTFERNPYPGAGYYYLRVWTADQPYNERTRFIIGERVDGTSYTPRINLPPGRYNWVVWAINPWHTVMTQGFTRTFDVQ